MARTGDRQEKRAESESARSPSEVAAPGLSAGRARPSPQLLAQLGAAAGNQAVARQIESGSWAKIPTAVLASPRSGLGIPASGGRVLPVTRPGEPREQAAEAGARSQAEPSPPPTALSNMARQALHGSRKRVSAPLDPRERSAKAVVSAVEAGRPLPTEIAGGLAARAPSSRLGLGVPLGAADRAWFETRFGADLAAARVHADAAATRALHTEAFTVGSTVVVDPERRRSPRSDRALLAHELTHVLQTNRDVIHRLDPDEPAGSGDAPEDTSRGPDWDREHEGRRYVGFNLPQLTGMSDVELGFRVELNPLSDDPRAVEAVVFYGETRHRRTARIAGSEDLVTARLLSVAPGLASFDLTGDGGADVELRVTPEFGVAGLAVSLTGFGRSAAAYVIQPPPASGPRPRYVEGRGFYAGTLPNGRRYYRVPFSEQHPFGPFYMDEDGRGVSPALEHRAEALGEGAEEGLLIGFAMLAGIALIAAAPIAAPAMAEGIGTGTTGAALFEGGMVGLGADVIIQGGMSALDPDYEYSPAQTAVSVATGGLGGIMARAGYSVVAIGAATGAAYPTGYRATQDVAAGEFSGVEAYVVDAITGALIGIVVGGVFSAATGGGGRGNPRPERLYHHTNAVDDILASERILARTEGRVYATELSELGTAGQRVRMGMRPGQQPSGTIELTDEAAGLFQPHPIEGWFSGLKHHSGQYVSREAASDIVFVGGGTQRAGNVLTISEAGFVPQSGGRALFSQSRMWGRRLFIDWGIPAAGAAGGVGIGAFTDYPTGRNLVPWERAPILDLLVGQGGTASPVVTPGDPAVSGPAAPGSGGAPPVIVYVVPRQSE